MKSIEDTLKLALEALKANYLLVNGTEKAGGLAWCIDGYYSNCFDLDPINEQTERAITAIEEALAPQNEVRGLSQPEQRSVSEHLEPVACIQDLDEVKRKHLVYEKGMDWKDPLYTTSPQRTWVGLTDEELRKIAYNTAERKVAKDIEAKLKEKNDC